MGCYTQNELIEIFTTDNKIVGLLSYNTNGLSCGLVGGNKDLYLNRRIIWHNIYK